MIRIDRKYKVCTFPSFISNHMAFNLGLQENSTPGEINYWRTQPLDNFTTGELDYYRS